jgi:small subunit ribosomal protein S4e
MKKHLKRLRIPKFWRVPKKHAKWAPKPRAGPHKQFESIPLMVILRDILKIADKGKEAKSIIKMGGVFVDGKYRKDQKYPVGVMDVVSMPRLKQQYRIVPTRKGLGLIEISVAESKKKICKIGDKTVVRGGKLQLNLHDGRNLLVDIKDSKKYNTGDSIVVELPSQKILNHVKLERGALALIIKGKNIGMLGKIEEIIVTKTKEPTKLICNVNGEKLEVIKDYIFVVGKDKPLIKLE